MAKKSQVLIEAELLEEIELLNNSKIVLRKETIINHLLTHIKRKYDTDEQEIAYSMVLPIIVSVHLKLLF